MPTPLPLMPPLSSPENVITAEFEEELPPLTMELLLPSVAESILVDGATVSTVQLREAGEGSLFATLSSDNTLKVWIPSLNDLEYVKGLVHVTNSDLSMLQPKWSIPTPPVSLPENANVIEVDLVLPSLVTLLLLPSVAESILVFGAAVSTVQLNDAGDGSLFATLSSDNTLNVWIPSFNDLEYVKGLVHVTNSDLSMLQPKWSIPTPPVSLPKNANVIEVDFVLAPLIMVLLLPSVAESILVDGATVSTVQLREAGEGSLFPTLSSDNTLKVWTPSFNDCGSLYGLVHVTNSDLSMLQPKWAIPTPPVSLPENANVVEVDLVLDPLVMAFLLPSVAESILVVGAVVSTFQLSEAGDGSLFPILSWALICTVWAPSGRL